jgi:uncharacterized protein with HEPN domain
MPKDDWVYIEHMLEISQKALDFTSGLEKADYDLDEPLRLALTHLVQMLGEAARQVSPTLREAYPEIPWHEIVGMRHRIVHDYLNVDEDVVGVIRQDIPPRRDHENHSPRMVNTDMDLYNRISRPSIPPLTNPASCIQLLSRLS